MKSFPFLHSWQRSRSTPRSPRQRKARSVPRIESLEARTLPSFAFGGSFTVGNNPYSVTVADLNGDGKPDLAVVNDGSNSVSVLFGNGDGTFKPAVNYAVDTDPRQIVAVDLNRDGKIDLVTSDGQSNAVSVLFNKGNGTFRQAINLATGGYSNTLAVADVNGDGKADIVTADEAYTSGVISVLLGNGNGTFAAPQVVPVAGTTLFGVTAADLNHDGKVDLVLGQAGTPAVLVLLGNGNGTFGAATSFATAPDPTSMAVADFNRDGKLDLITANNASPFASVLLGNGNGTFQAAQNYAIGTPAYGVSVADVNGDGHADAVITHVGTTKTNDTVTVLLGNGDGSFTSALNFAIDPYPGFAAVADLNGDGRPDIAVPIDNNRVGILLNTWAAPATGTFSPGPTVSAPGTYTYGPRIADVNGDGTPDLIEANYPANVVSVFLGNGNGTFKAAVNTPAGPGPDNVTVADVNGDGIPDLILTYYGANEVAILQGNGDGTFKPAMQILVTGNDPRSLQVADVNRDGKPDLVVASFSSTGVQVFLGNGDGTFQAPQNLSVGSYPTDVAVADVNGDGKPDIISANWDYHPGSYGVSVLLGNGDGTFQAPQTVSLTTMPFSVNVADVNGDGKPDVVVGTFSGSSYPYSGGVVVLLGNGNGTFAMGSTINLGVETFLESLADVNGDGKSDLVTETFKKSVSVYLGNGDGTFAAPLNTAVSDAGYGVAVADLNGDGRPDLVVPHYSTPTFTVLLGDHNAATHFAVSAPAVTVAGNYFAVTVDALTAGNQEDALYSGAVALTSSDPTFVAPPAYTFTLADGGSHTFFVDLQKAGRQTITATDTVTGSITGTAVVQVVAAAATHLKVSAPPTATAGTAFNFTVTALDRFGNIATGYRGIIHFSSSDAAAMLPHDYTFTSTDKGKHTFSATLNTVGAQTITATDTMTGSITGKATISVAAVAGPYAVVGDSSPSSNGLTPALVDQVFASDPLRKRGVFVGGRR
jgi:hypothetical protein